MRLDDFDYALPTELIAQQPASKRSASRLLVLDRGGGTLADRMFTDLPTLLRPGDLLVLNDTRVIKARFHGEKETGGRVEMLIERVVDAHRAWVLIRASHAPKPGMRLTLAHDVVARVIERHDDRTLVEFEGDASVLYLAQRYGELPLPPYITRAADAEDESRYQTVYAREPGSVAAPTAGLHFDDAILAALRERGIETTHVTLHVGAGTFQPVRTDDITEHRMHHEWYRFPAEAAAAIKRTKRRGGRVVAVGTTALRTLESVAARSPSAIEDLDAHEGETALFIYPGFDFHVVDALLTNFHLPRSTLLVLVSAFAGREAILAAYAHAVHERYRFFSYGDAMLIL